MKAPSTLAPGLIRLEKYMAQAGMTSRREAKDLIVNRLVTVNGKVITNPGFGIDPSNAKVVIDNAGAPKKETYLVYKPRNVETTKTSDESDDLHDVFPKLTHLSPIGRLDKDSEGLIIMSNDGTLAKALTKKNSTVGKQYLVGIREEVTPAMMTRMSEGIMLNHIMTKPAKAEKVDKNSFVITLYEGRKHQIRRMCEECHTNVTSLNRVAIGHITAPDLRAGRYIPIAQKDIDLLKK